MLKCCFQQDPRAWCSYRIPSPSFQPLMLLNILLFYMALLLVTAQRPLVELLSLADRLSFTHRKKLQFFQFANSLQNLSGMWGSFRKRLWHLIMPLQQQELMASVQENFRENISLLQKDDYPLLNFIYLLTVITLAFCICLSFWKTCLLHCGTYCCFIMRFASTGNRTDFFQAAS